MAKLTSLFISLYSLTLAQPSASSHTYHSKPLRFSLAFPLIICDFLQNQTLSLTQPRF